MSHFLTDTVGGSTKSTQEPVPQPSTSSSSGDRQSTTDSDSNPASNTDTGRTTHSTTTTSTPQTVKLLTTSSAHGTEPNVDIVTSSSHRELKTDSTPSHEVLHINSTRSLSVDATSLLGGNSHGSDARCCDNSSTVHIEQLSNSTGVDSSVKQRLSSDQLILIGVGGGSCILFLLVTTATAIVLCRLKSRRQSKPFHSLVVPISFYSRSSL